MAIACLLPVEEGEKQKKTEELLCNEAELPVTIENTRQIIRGLVRERLRAIMEKNSNPQPPI